jgi:hypothetical protein
LTTRRLLNVAAAIGVVGSWLASCSDSPNPSVGAPSSGGAGGAEEFGGSSAMGGDSGGTSSGTSHSGGTGAGGTGTGQAGSNTGGEQSFGGRGEGGDSQALGGAAGASDGGEAQGGEGQGGLGYGGEGGASGASTGGAGGAENDPFGCVDEPLPTTAPATVEIAGFTSRPLAPSPGNISGIDVAAIWDSTFASDTSDGSGNYLLSISTGDVPVDAYLQGSDASLPLTRLYFDKPIAGDLDNVELPFIASGDLGLIEGFCSVDQNPTNGLFLVKLVDCDGGPVPSAAATVKQGGILVGQQCDFRTFEGEGYVVTFNVPPGATDVAGESGPLLLSTTEALSIAGAVTVAIVGPR